MTQVNFYTLASEETATRLQFVCRLTEKAYSLGHKIHIQTDSVEQLKRLDDLLWQYSAHSFIPHRVLGSDKDAAAMVSLAADSATAEHGDVLINLSSEACPQHNQYARINEVIAGDMDSLEQGRNRYRFYKECGHQIETFKI